MFGSKSSDHYDRGLRLARALADPVIEAQLTTHLGDTYEAMGDHASARERWQQAYKILTDVGHPQAADVSRRLDPTPSPGGS